ncbi:MAG: hypothetical protein M1820_006929 [Bogoriella megaspora]|nr:MAG: hypothetical protein M1820_006929 [Bogoriella megaspora]
MAVPNARNPHLGGQDFEHCCMLAANASLEINDGYLAFSAGQAALHGSAERFQRFQFPCGAKFNGSAGDQPQVTVSYSWCHANCPGWEAADTSNYGFWIEPLVAFIIPSIVFCLSVPRRRRIEVPDTLFPRSGGLLSTIPTLLFKIPVASFIVTIDTLLWLAAILALSGPILISGIYEAVLDLRLLNYLQQRTNNNELTVQERAKLLFIVLLGNLDVNPAWQHMEKILSTIPKDRLTDRFSLALTNSTFSAEVPSLSRKSTKKSQTISEGFSLRSPSKVMHQKQQVSYQIPEQKRIDIIKATLKSLLGSQQSFGTTVGAPVIFFTGGFVYTMIDIEANYGAAYIAHRLAFGMFWMIIPHVAVTSSPLLAGNNPSTWQGATGHFPSFDPESGQNQYSAHTPHGDNANTSPKLLQSIRHALYKPIYPLTYQPAWIWSRGSNKERWLSQAAEANVRLRSLKDDVLIPSSMKFLVAVTIPVLSLLLVPTVLGGLISYETPVVGISCRAGTIMLYTCSQLLLVLLWISKMRTFGRDLDVEAIHKKSTPTWMRCSKLLWFFLFASATTMSIFTSIGGTMFTFMNLYVNCLCFIPISQWKTRYSPDTMTYLSSNSSEDIRNAKLFWFPCGMSATAFLITVTYLGWWYQRRLRVQFTDLTSGIDQVNVGHIQENEYEVERDTSGSRSRAVSV